MNSRLSYRVKRSCIHNVRITASNMAAGQNLSEGLVMPREMMRIADIAPFEQIIVTKIGGDNWANRMYTFAIPGDSDAVEARGSISHLLKRGELCCVITGSQLSGDCYLEQLDNRCRIPIIDVRLYPDEPVINDLGRAKTVIEYGDQLERVSELPGWIEASRSQLPRVVLSNLLSGLTVQEVEKRGCIEMSAELPIDYMKKAGFCKNQSIFVYNSSRGGTSAESYVVPSLSKKTVGISGALSAVADVGDVISEAGFVTTTEPFVPTIYDLLGGGSVDLSRYTSAP